MSVAVRGAGSDLSAVLSLDQAEIKVTGPYSSVQSLDKGALIAYVDVSGLSAGEYELPVMVEVDNEPDLTFEVYPEKLKVTLTSAG